MSQETQEHATVVGSTFVRKYYEYLAQQKDSLYKFYGENACRTYIDDELDESIRTRVASGIQNIKQQIDNVRYDDLGLDLAAPYGSVNCQPTIGGCIVVTVTGLIGFYGKATRRLVQTVVLQRLPNAGPYVVVNDMFHVLKEDASAVREVNVTEIVQPVVNEASQQTEPIAEIPYDEPIPTEDVTAARQPHAIEAEEAPDLAALRLEGQENGAFPEEELPSGSKSWVQVVGANAKNAAPPASTAPKGARAQRQKKEAAPAGQQAPRQGAQNNGRRQQGKGSAAAAAQGKKGGSTSIFIKGDVLPALEMDELRELFGVFGTIKDITGSQEDMKLYIHYDNPAAVDSALERKTEHARGKPINILPARSKTSGRGRGGRRGN
eukprot:gb/GECG01000648.1/.p1 GENE.gb/GECG01000648.1/~~gb/GECG01000648.1/.p1  ORF type:complete len:379 (+),score=62.45 gb/GECG01000648.1/:1-1137(+)